MRKEEKVIASLEDTIQRSRQRIVEHEAETADKKKLYNYYTDNIAEKKKGIQAQLKKLSLEKRALDAQKAHYYGPDGKEAMGYSVKELKGD